MAPPIFNVLTFRSSAYFFKFQIISRSVIGATKKMSTFFKKVKIVQKVILKIVRTTQSVKILKSSDVVIFRYLSKINVIETRSHNFEPNRK